MAGKSATPHQQKRSPPWTALLFMGGALLLGLFLWYWTARAARRVARLPISTPADLLTAEVGSEVLIEGRISDDNPALHPSAGFVAYYHQTREIETDDNGQPDPTPWRITERQTPPLLIETTGGPVQIENDDYDLDLIPHTDTGPKFGSGAHIRYSVTRDLGFLGGDPVVVVGRVRGGGEIPRIRADFVAGGTKETYIAAQRKSGPIAALSSVIMALLGGALLTWERWWPSVARLFRPRGADEP